MCPRVIDVSESDRRGARPQVHGGILAKRGDPEHMETLKEHKIGTIDLVVGNLYPFKQTVASGAALT